MMSLSKISGAVPDDVSAMANGIKTASFCMLNTMHIRVFPCFPSLRAGFSLIIRMLIRVAEECELRTLLGLMPSACLQLLRCPHKTMKGGGSCGRVQEIAIGKSWGRGEWSCRGLGNLRP